MAIDFPTSPTPNQLHTAGSRSWSWNNSVGAWYAVNAGVQGIQGIQGTQGTQGLQGITGSQGTQGTQGIQGIQGVQGIQGITGLAFTIAKTYLSVAALNADTAPTAIVAGQFALINTTNVEDAENSRLYIWTGSTYTFVDDLSGSAGIQGITGSQGVQGIQGIQGTAGFVGSNGAQGIQGITGSQGTVGSQGITGSTGSTGSQGIAGTQGAVGSQGTIGTSVTGAQGTQGVSGASILGTTNTFSGTNTFNSTITGSVSGSSATTAKVAVPDFRSTSITPSYFGSGVAAAFMSNSTDGLSDGGAYHGILQIQQWSDASGGGSHQLGFTDSNNIHHRGSSGGLTTWSSWYKFLDSNNYNSYSPTLTGGGASGTWGINVTGSSGSCSGNAATASTLSGWTSPNTAGLGGPWNQVAAIASNGVMEIGRYLDFHVTASDGADYGVRLDNSSVSNLACSGNFNVTGAITATLNITAYYSDDRLKTRLGSIDNALSKVLSLNGFYFEANETAQALGYTKKKEVGVSAQEVELVLPEIIAPAPIDAQYKTLDYSKLVPLLIEAIKDLNAKVDSLQTQLNNK